MKINFKTIRDPIHGNIRLEGLFLEILESPEIQRLHNIKQLGFAHLVFPGGHHTRIEHSIGTYYMSLRVAEALALTSDEKRIFSCASILHDIGHGPFSHTLEFIIREKFDVDHIDLTEKLILGEYKIFDDFEEIFIDSSSVHDILNKYDVDHEYICKIIKGKTSKKTYMSQLLNSSIDVDQLDYLLRDAYYCGVAYGIIDIGRYLQTLEITNNKLVIKRKGVGVVENILMARTLMYSSVYFHKTVRIAELMLSKAIELLKNADAFELFKLTDAELITELRKLGEYQKEIITRIKYRRLFKSVYSLTSNNLDEKKVNIIKKLQSYDIKREKEIEIEDTLNIPRGHIIIDVPYSDLNLLEPRINDTNIDVIDKGQCRKIAEYTPIINALQTRNIPDWKIMIIADEKYRNIVEKKVEKILFS
jgi:HD superfamily phosphohydrolase